MDNEYENKQESTKIPYISFSPTLDQVWEILEDKQKLIYSKSKLVHST
jgi:hypothetical protein